MIEKEPTPKWAKWGVDFSLAYDGGGSEFTKFYRTKVGAFISIWWKKNVFSWGGTHNLFPIVTKRK